MSQQVTRTSQLLSRTIGQRRNRRPPLKRMVSDAATSTDSVAGSIELERIIQNSNTHHCLQYTRSSNRSILCIEIELTNSPPPRPPIY